MSTWMPRLPLPLSLLLSYLHSLLRKVRQMQLTWSFIYSFLTAASICLFNTSPPFSSTPSSPFFSLLLPSSPYSYFSPLVSPFSLMLSIRFWNSAHCSLFIFRDTASLWKRECLLSFAYPAQFLERGRSNNVFEGLRITGKGCGRYDCRCRGMGE